MTLRLILTRHAKSSWADPTLDDHDRPLNKRGRKSARAMGEWIVGQGWIPDQILCSTATRTRETLARMRFPPVTPEYSETLYLASGAQMFSALRRATGQTVLMVGHNAGIAEFALALAAHPPTHDRFADYPTCATTLFEFATEDWGRIGHRSGIIRGFAIPRELLQ